MKLGLRARLGVAILGILVALLAVCATLVVMRADDALARGERARLEATSRQLADTIGYPVLARSEVLLGPSLDAFARSPDLLYVEVRDDAGQVIASRGILPTGRSEGRSVRIEAPNVATDPLSRS